MLQCNRLSTSFVPIRIDSTVSLAHPVNMLVEGLLSLESWKENRKTQLIVPRHIIYIINPKKSPPAAAAAAAVRVTPKVAYCDVAN